MHIAWCEYEATGEGRTVMIAVGNRKSAATNIFKCNFNDYYHVGMQCDSWDHVPEGIRAFIPEPVKVIYNRTKGLCLVEYHAEFHINCS